MPLNLAFLWHMHQPCYQVGEEQRFVLPWVYLHALKDYTDMAAHLERHPAMRLTVNFVPTLLEQIQTYSQQIEDFFQRDKPLRDPLLAGLSRKQLPRDEFPFYLEACLKVHAPTHIDPYPPYQRLATVAREFLAGGVAANYGSQHFVDDLLMWYHLTWCGESLKRESLELQDWLRRGKNFSFQDKIALLRFIGKTLKNIVPRYRRLAERGQIELSMTPYAHPLMPLLLDYRSARQAVPELPLPEGQYPDGAARVRWQIEHGQEVFAQFFGQKAQGMWPSEGAIDNQTVSIAAEFGFRWLASGEQTLRNTLRQCPEQCHWQNDPHWLHRLYRFQNKGVHLFFRDDGLSDNIGFRYQKMPVEQAVGDFIYHLETIAKHHEARPDAIVSIILDGENAWEYYPSNGYVFLDTLYQRLSQHPKLRLCTMQESLTHAANNPALERLVAGSWVFGSLTTWIGHPDKNRAWTLLQQAKQDFDQKISKLTDKQRQAAAIQLALCEGSDWFWWFGDYNPSQSVQDFDRLFRLHLQELYRLLRLPSPKSLEQPISQGNQQSQAAAGGTMRSSF
jgi:alpha-amylase/alpha-mannosidase (GH57 family)